MPKKNPYETQNTVEIPSFIGQSAESLQRKLLAMHGHRTGIRYRLRSLLLHGDGKFRCHCFLPQHSKQRLQYCQ